MVVANRMGRVISRDEGDAIGIDQSRLAGKTSWSYMERHLKVGYVCVCIFYYTITESEAIVGCNLIGSRLKNKKKKKLSVYKTKQT